MWYEKDFTIPLFCKKVKFEYDRETGKYTGKFLITKNRLIGFIINGIVQGKGIVIQ